LKENILNNLSNWISGKLAVYEKSSEIGRIWQRIPVSKLRIEEKSKTGKNAQ